jgi:hypothetical protein
MPIDDAVRVVDTDLGAGSLDAEQRLSDDNFGVVDELLHRRDLSVSQ